MGRRVRATGGGRPYGEGNAGDHASPQQGKAASLPTIPQNQAAKPPISLGGITTDSPQIINDNPPIAPARLDFSTNFKYTIRCVCIRGKNPMRLHRKNYIKGPPGFLNIGGLQVKKVGKPVFFVVALLIFALTALSFTGISGRYGDITTTYIKGVGDIRWGIDIRGGVDVTFFPSGGYEATPAEMAGAEAVIRQRLLVQNITDFELYPDHDNNRIILRFPWRADEVDFNPIRAIEELGATAMLTFREGMETDENRSPAGVTAETIILTGSDVASATTRLIPNELGGMPEHVVQLTLHESGRQAFSEATGRLVGQTISIWMDDEMISNPTVNERITGGVATITGSPQQGGFTAEEASRLANQIAGGALPFSLETDNYNTISPTLGMGALQAMLLAGVISFALISVYMVFQYRASGFVAVIGLVGQLGLMIAAVTGFFPFVPSFVLTLPGIAGIILSIAMGVDANIITAERIREELYAGRTLDGAVASGYKRAFAAIFDGNITVIIVAVILMGSFGPSNSLFARMLSPIFFMFGPTTAGAIYSFGYTLLVGVIANFVMGIFACRLMQRSLCRMGPMRKAWLFGGER